MAFQTGTRVNPRLGALNFSGFERAAEINRQGISELGAKVRDTVNDFTEKRREQEQQKVTEQALSEYMSEEEAKAYSKAPPEVSAEILRQAQIQKNQEAAEIGILFGKNQDGSFDISKAVSGYFDGGGEDLDNFLGIVNSLQGGVYKKQEQDYLSGLRKQDEVNRKALMKSIMLNRKADGSIDKTYAMPMYEKFGGQDAEKATKVFDALSEGKMSIQQVNDHAIVLDTKGDPTFMVPSRKGDERGGIPPEARRTEVISRARKLFNEGKLDESDDLILGLGIRDNVTGMLVNAAALFGSAGATEPATGEQAQPDPLGIR